MNSMAHKFAGNLDDVENRMLADFVLEAHGEYFPSYVPFTSPSLHCLSQRLPFIYKSGEDEGNNSCAGDF